MPPSSLPSARRSRSVGPHVAGPRSAGLRVGLRVGGAVVLGLGLLACSTPDCSGSEQAGGYVSCDGAITVLEPDEREPAPRIAGETLQGDPLALADYAGDVVVLNVWGSWCGPCVAEAPHLNEAAQRLAPDGVQFVGVNIRDQVARARTFEAQQEVPYPSLYDPDSSTLLGMPDGMFPSATPTTYVIDAQGRVAVRVLDETTASTLSGLVEDVLAEGDGSGADASGNADGSGDADG